MAILNEDEDEFKNVERPVSGGTSYVGGGYAGGGQNQAPQVSGPKASKGTGFVNIEDYLSGGTGKAAEKIASNTDVMGSSAMRDIGDYDTEVNKSTNVKDFSPETASGWLLDVSANAMNPGQRAEFKQNVPSMMQTVKPTGFSDLATHAPAQAKVAKVSDRVKQSGTQEGLQGQMKELVSPGMNYTAGMNRFDAMGAQVGAGAEAIKNSQQKWGGINNWLSNSEQSAQGKIEGAREKATNVNAQWQRAGELAQQKAGETNKYFDDLATQKQKALNDKNKIAQETAESQGRANEQWGKDYLNKDTANKDANKERTSWIGPLKPGGIKDGWIWSQQDIDNYLKTGNKPNRRQEAYGVYSTPEGDY